MRKLIPSIFVFFLIITAVLPLFAENNEPSSDMVLVRGGKFMMGEKSDFSGEDYSPPHNVTVKDFWIAKYEVTQKEWTEIMGTNPSFFQDNDLNPVESVDFYDCLVFCNKKSVRENLKPYYIINDKDTDPNNTNPNDTKKYLITTDPAADGYRLLSEEEWEYAAREGKSKGKYKFSGSNKSKDVGWNVANSEETTHPAGKKKANKLGIYDLTGNVYEWCYSTYEKYPGSRSWAYFGPAFRVMRGGSFSSYDTNCLNIFRTKNYAAHKSKDLGLRLARSAALKSEKNNELVMEDLPKEPEKVDKDSKSKNLRNRIVAEAKTYIGVPYKWGGKNRKGVDCTGLVNCVLRGLIPSRPLLSMKKYLKYQKVSLKKLKPGDFVFFNPYGKGIGHIGIYIGNKQFIHAPGFHQKVRIDKFDRYWGRVLVRATQLYKTEKDYIVKNTKTRSVTIRKAVNAETFFSSAFKTTYGTMKLKVNKDGTVSGTIEHPRGKGKISGTIDSENCVLSGTWSLPPTFKGPEDSGKVEFSYAGGNDMDGRWCYGTDDNWMEDWSGERIP
ncbi:MAG: SUMF1/EgtB/PvdO family nonheme iron enzyme [Spirochaetales bacterium]|nr:SUMF1/EgtB/PvdO family nonheme iron enzyme [Spirochaetales bacterium]